MEGAFMNMSLSVQAFGKEWVFQPRELAQACSFKKIEFCDGQFDLQNS